MLILVEKMDIMVVERQVEDLKPLLWDKEYHLVIGVDGGGGGYYGGGHTGTWTGGGGGTGYITGLSNAQTIAGNQPFPAPVGGTETGHSGNGYARITLIE